ncbi:hypothetical protein C0991_004914 [Blastosporella zonata]|nr:hypothetical protein C0991_004914 [Blastosporella zonata]
MIRIQASSVHVFRILVDFYLLLILAPGQVYIHAESNRKGDVEKEHDTYPNVSEMTVASCKHNEDIV